MKNKIFYQISLCVASIICCVLGLIYSIDGCAFINELQKEGILVSMFFEVMFVITSCISMLITIPTLVCSFFKNNKMAYNIFKILASVNIFILFATAIILFVYFMTTRLSITKLYSMMHDEGSAERFILSLLTKSFIIPSSIACIASQIMGIVSFAIYNSNEQTFEIELSEEVVNNIREATEAPEEKTLEQKILDLENKIKEKKLLKKYNDLLQEYNEEE